MEILQLARILNARQNLVSISTGVTPIYLTTVTWTYQIVLNTRASIDLGWSIPLYATLCTVYVYKTYHSAKNARK